MTKNRETLQQELRGSRTTMGAVKGENKTKKNVLLTVVTMSAGDQVPFSVSSPFFF
jgi:hypothetical protein